LCLLSDPEFFVKISFFINQVFITACTSVAKGIAKNNPHIPHKPPKTSTATIMATGWILTTPDRR